ncbi:YfbM family protein [Sphingobacterium spiritivorum]|uniref:YfbM family protein n=1 Tax=Sphingobacterium spiritivorum TaxID=258 RepID=UPI001F1DCF2F|nr:YfbM family protein [Sphingobacterium spiritivorum]
MGMIANLLRVTTSELEAYLKDSSLLEDSIYNDEEDTENLVDIDKSWDGIIFLLTGQSLATAKHNLVRILFSGQIIDEEQDLGYGPAHYLTAEQVAELNGEISAITIADLKQRFNPEKMNELEIYPIIWDEGDDAFDYLADGFLTLQNVFAEATKNKEAIITIMN